jgi:dipeptidyl aminopeptidase/acylaminoacyl peptidase
VNTRPATWSALWCELLLSAAAHGTPPPVEAYGQVEAVSHVTISPGGTHLAWAANDGKETQVAVFEIASRKILRTFKVEPGFKVREIDWANDDSLLFAISATLTSTRRRWPSRLEYLQWLAADVATGRSRLLLTEGNKRVLGGSQIIRRRIANEPALLVMASMDFAAQNQGSEIGTRLGGKRKDSGYQYNVFSMDVSTGKSKLLESGTPFTQQWLANAQGKPVVRSEWNPELGRYSVFVKDGSGWKRLLETRDSGDSFLAGLADGDTSVLVFTNNGGSRTTLWSLPFDGSGAKKLVDDPDRDAEGLTADPYASDIQAVRFSGADRPYRWIDAAAQKRYAALGRTFGGRYIDVESRSADNKRIIVEVDGASTPTVYYLVDYAAKSADIVGEQYPGLVDKPQGAVRRFEYSARDKYSLFGYLTIPPGAEDKEIAAGRAAARRTGVRRHAMVRLVVAVPGLAGLRRAASAVPRLYRPRRRASPRRPWPVGSANAGRRHRRRESPDRSGHRRSEARVYRRCELWRLRGAGRSGLHARTLCLRSQCRRSV